MSVTALRVGRTEIPGLFDLFAEPQSDERGYVVKTFEVRAYTEAGLSSRCAEELHSFSKRGVVRGMHFQTPPASQAKTVFCVHGAVFDVVLDLRMGSPSYRRVVTRELSARAGHGLYVPEGCAHGFCVLSEQAVVAYRLTTPYAAGHDAGVLWNSIDAGWPITDPVLSQRDRRFVSLADFESPFTFETREV